MTGGNSANPPTQQPPAEPGNQAPGTSEFERLAAKEQQFYREKQEFAKKQKELEERQKKLDLFEKDPYEYYQSQGKDVNSLVDRMLGNPESQQQLQDENPQLNPDELKQKLKEDIINELNQEKAKEAQKTNEEKAINDYKDKIQSYFTEQAEKLPLSSGIGTAKDTAWSLIEEDFNRKTQEFGMEYAKRNIMTIEEAGQKVETHLANEIESVLQSEQVRNFLLTKINAFKANPGQQNPQNQSNNENQSNSPGTLTNELFNSPSFDSGNKPNHQMTDEEAFENALKFVKS